MQDQIQINRTIEALEGIEYVLDIYLSVLENKMTPAEIEKMWENSHNLEIANEARQWLTDEELDMGWLIEKIATRVKEVAE